MRVLVFGASGLVGRHLVRELQRREIEVEGTSVRVEDSEAVGKAISRRRTFSHVVNAVGIASVDACELDLPRAFAIHARGAENIAMWCVPHDSVCVQISTEYVHDGSGLRSRALDEFAPAHSLSTYARSKHMGEMLVAAAAPARHQIIRLQNVYGEGGKNFLSKAAAGEIADRYDCVRYIQPTWAGDAARMMIEIMMLGQFGIWHASACEQTTYLGFAQTAANHVITTATKYQSNEHPTIQLAHARLRMHGIAPPTWEESLEHYRESVQR